MKRVLDLGNLSRIVEGDPDLIAEGQIPVIRDSSAVDRIADVQQRISGNMVSLITD